MSTCFSHVIVASGIAWGRIYTMTTTMPPIIISIVYFVIVQKTHEAGLVQIFHDIVQLVILYTSVGYCTVEN